MSRPRHGSEAATGLSRAPRLALTRQEAAAALGISINSFERHVQPELRLVRRGKLRLIPVRELERWLEENSEAIIDLRPLPRVGLDVASRRQPGDRS
jgi:hypothetical protein